MIPLAEPKISENAWKYVKSCLDTGWISYAGDYVDKLEQQVKAYTGAKHAVAVNGGTSGLMLALRLAGVGHEDEVLVPSLTFIATINAIKHVGAEPVFMDCEDYDLNMDWGKTLQFIEEECVKTPLGLQNKLTGRRVKAILPVHILGNLSAAPIALQRVAKEYRLAIIEDAAEAMGTWCTSGAGKDRHAGTYGDLGVFSFSFNKMVTAGGGGLIITDNEEYGKRGKYLALQAKDDIVRYVHNDVGYNLGLTNIGAALACSQMECLDTFLDSHRLWWKTYSEELEDLPGLTVFSPPNEEEANFWLIAVTIDENKFGMNPEKLMTKLYTKGVQTRPLWMPSHMQAPYLRCQRFRIEKTEQVWRKTLCIPSGNTMTTSTCKEVVEAIREVQREG